MAPTTIFLRVFCGRLAFPTETFLQSHAHNKRLHLRGWGAQGLRPKEMLCAGDIVKSDDSHFFSLELCLKFGGILFCDKSALFPH